MMRDRESTPALTDAAIKAMFDRRARRAQPADLRGRILTATLSEPQRAGFRRRLPFLVPHRVVRALVVALIAAALIGLALLGVGVRNQESPSPTGVATEFIRPFEYAILSNGTIRQTSIKREIVAWITGPDIPASPDRPEPAPGETAPPPYAGGLVVGSAETAWSHGGAGRFMLRTAPAEFLADLRDTGGLPMGEVVETTLDGRPALIVDLPGTGGSDIHVNGPIESLSRDYVMVNTPGRLIVADVDGATVFILIWAFTPSELDTWLPVANEFVSSIQFNGGDQP